MIPFLFKVFFMERITSTAYLEPLDLEGQVHTVPREWIPILQTSETIMLNILCFSWVEEETSTQNGGTERFSFWPQLRKLGFHPWPEANQIYTYPWPKAKQCFIHCGWLMISFSAGWSTKISSKNNTTTILFGLLVDHSRSEPPRQPDFILL